jgi:CubicO group peptidase (beta-lactamase class C family)
MKKVLKYLALAIISILIVMVVFLSVKYSPTYVYRLIWFNVADVYDYTYFENRHIKASDSAFMFKRKLNERYVESLFHDKVISTGNESLDEWAEKSKTTALIFIQRDTILYEKYFNGFDRGSYFHSQSMAKSFISFLIGAAIDDGLIKSINDPMTKYIPELKKRDSRFEKITVEDLLMMRSGLKYNTSKLPFLNIHAPWHDEAVGYYHENVRKLLLDKVQISSEPGKYFQYCNYNTSYLGLIIERATGKTVSQYLQEKLWSQMMEYDALFSIDSKESGFEYMPSRLIARAIDYARFGRLFLNDGNWNGKQLISVSWIKKSILEDESVPRKFYPDYFGGGCKRTYYTYQWWGHRNCDSTYQFFANGNLGQIIYIIPHEDIIIVHCGNSNELFSAYDLWHVADCIHFVDFHQSIMDDGVNEAIQEFRKKKKQNPYYQPFSERFLVDKGYAYLDGGEIEDAKKIFALNIETYPKSWVVYNNLAEAYSAAGANDSAILLYKKSLALKPENNWATEKLKMLE